MNSIKPDQSDKQAKQLKQVAEVLKVIAHPLRLKIIKHLGTKSRASVSELIEQTGVEQSLVSHHLIKLKDKGVLIGEREGKNVYYTLADNHILNIFECMDQCDLID
jgi:DNA-binding transcriptional ArsR family regulator